MNTERIHPSLELFEDNHLSISRTRKEPGIVCQMPKAFMFDDILPGWSNTLVWSYTTRRMDADFVAVRLEILAGGGTEYPIQNSCENFFFVLEGEGTVKEGSQAVALVKNSFFWVPPDRSFEIRANRGQSVILLWLKKKYEELKEIPVPEPVFGNTDDLPVMELKAEYKKECLPCSSGYGFDMDVSILIYDPGITSDRAEVHMGAHGIYVLGGRGDVVVNGVHYETHKNDYLYIAPCASHYMTAYAPVPLILLVYEDVNRDIQM